MPHAAHRLLRRNRSPLAVGLALLVGLGAALTTPGARAADDTPEPTVLSQRNDRRIVQLDNGLVIIAQRIPTAPVVSVHSWVKAGSVYEQEFNGAGVSHFLEHLVSGGSTSTRTEAESNEILGEIGAQTNAATSLDTVRYYINTSDEHTETAIDLMSDWMQNSLIKQEEFEREKQVIQREFDMGRGEPDRIFWKLTQQARYQVHPARHPTIGYIDEFMALSRDDVKAFYDRMYVPNNMVFVVSGKIDPERAVERVATRFADDESSDLPAIVFPEETGIEEPTTSTGHADIDRPRLRLAWPGTRLTEEGDYALDLLAQVLGQGELSRLVQAVRDKKQLVTSIDAYNASFDWGRGFFGVDATVKEGKMAEARQAILDEVERLKTIGVTEEELDRAKQKTIAGVVYDAQTAQASASRLARDFINTGDPNYMQHYADAVKELTIADLQRAAHRFLKADKLMTIKLLPAEDDEVGPLKRPDEEPAPELSRRGEDRIEMRNLDNASLVERMKALEERAEDTRAAEVGPMKMHTLDNGLRVVIQRNTRLPAVSMQWYHLGGLMADEPGREGVANAMAQMMIKGAGDRSADDISRQTEDLGANLSTDSGNSTFHVTAQSLSEDWPAIMGLMSDVIQRPTFPADEWAKMQPRLLASIDSLSDQWHTQLRYAFREAYFGEGHPWSSPIVGRRDVVKDLTAEQLKAFHEKRISASQGVLAVIGDVEPEKVLDRVRSEFSALPAEPEIAFEAKAHKPIEPRTVTIETDKPMVAVEIGYGPGLKRNNPDYASMEVMNRVMSSFPTGWLDQALRGQGPGLVYAVGSGMMTGAAPGYWAILFNTQPKTLSKAMSRSLDIVDRIRSERVDDATLQRARTAAVVREALSRQSNGQRAGAVALDELYGIGYDHSDAFIQKLRDVDAGKIQAVARKYLDRPVAVVLSNQPIEASDLPDLQGDGDSQASASGDGDGDGEQKSKAGKKDGRSGKKGDKGGKKRAAQPKQDTGG